MFTFRVRFQTEVTANLHEKSVQFVENKRVMAKNIKNKLRNLLVGTIFGDQIVPNKDTLCVIVDGTDRMVTGVQQNHVGRFGADPWHGQQVVAYDFCFSRQKRHQKTAPFFGNFPCKSEKNINTVYQNEVRKSAASTGGIVGAFNSTLRV